MFLKRKRCGKIKARGYANGRSQNERITKLESSSLCVKTHALFPSCLINVFEQRNVIIANIPGALLSADWPLDMLDCHDRFKSAMMNMLCQIKLEY